MKKLLAIFTSAVMLVLVFSGCKVTESQVENKANQTSKKTINDILAESQANNTTVAPKVDYPELNYSAEVDLTQLQHGLFYRIQHS